MASRNQEREQRWQTVLTQWHQSEQTISAFCQGYRGFVHADAYDGYNAVHRNLRHLG